MERQPSSRLVQMKSRLTEHVAKMQQVTSNMQSIRDMAVKLNSESEGILEALANGSLEMKKQLSETLEFDRRALQEAVQKLSPLTTRPVQKNHKPIPRLQDDEPYYTGPDESPCLAIPPESLKNIVARVVGKTLSGGKAVYIGVDLCIIHPPAGVEHQVGESVRVVFPSTGRELRTVVIGKLHGAYDAAVVEGELPEAFELDVLLKKCSGKVLVSCLSGDDGRSLAWSTGVCTSSNKSTEFILSLDDPGWHSRSGDAVFTCRSDGVVRLLGVVFGDGTRVDTGFTFIISRIFNQKRKHQKVLEPLGVDCACAPLYVDFTD